MIDTSRTVRSSLENMSLSAKKTMKVNFKASKLFFLFLSPTFTLKSLVIWMLDFRLSQSKIEHIKNNASGYLIPIIIEWLALFFSIFNVSQGLWYFCIITAALSSV